MYEALKAMLSKNYLGGRRPSPGEAAVCGMIAGGVSAAITTPLDVVKTRVMLEAKVSLVSGEQGDGLTGKTSVPSVNGQKPIRQPSPSVLSFYPRLLDIAQKQGAKALFAGWFPRTTAISLGGAVFLGIYDFAVNFGKGNEPV